MVSSQLFCSNFYIVFILFPAAKSASSPAIPKDYLGMLECKREDETRLIQNIILGR